MPKKVKTIPSFNSEDAERDFWSKVDALDYFDTQKAVSIDLSELKPSTESISIRLPSSMLRRIKQMAHAKDVPYQSLMKMYLSKQLDLELRDR